MAAGRPLVVTPRRETMVIVDRYGVGIAAADDRPESMADAIIRILGDELLARRLGAAGRVAAETVFDWPIVSDRIADAVLSREGLAR